MQLDELKITITPARKRGDVGGRTELTRNGQSVNLGREATIELPHVSGHPNGFLSREAIQLELDEAGRALLRNISQSHEIICRPWGRGSTADDHIEHRRGDSISQRDLPRGVYWLRNGRPWDPGEFRYGSARGDGRSSWVLVEVNYRNPLARFTRPHDRQVEPDDYCEGRTYGAHETPRSWEINDKQYRGILIYFAQYLSWPPAVEPKIPADSTAERFGLGSGEWSRIDHLVASASRRGFTGTRVELLAWLISQGYLKFSQIEQLAATYGLRTLLRPSYRYSPLPR